MLEEDEHDECRIAELLQARRSASLSPRLSAAAHCMRLSVCARQPFSNRAYATAWACTSQAFLSDARRVLDAPDASSADELGALLPRLCCPPSSAPL